MTTSRIFVSPACAPRAGPLQAIEPGTHAIAEASPFPEGYHASTLYLVVEEKPIDFSKETFDAKVIRRYLSI
jgi:hypothetical protein